jgi:hypothetical protein
MYVFRCGSLCLVDHSGEIGLQQSMGYRLWTLSSNYGVIKVRTTHSDHGLRLVSKAILSQVHAEIERRAFENDLVIADRL